MFVDAAHFVFGPFLGYLWCVVRLFVPGPSGRKRYNVLAASLRIELLYLPSYWPNLNLMERLWKFVKKECLGGRVLAS